MAHDGFLPSWTHEHGAHLPSPHAGCGSASPPRSQLRTNNNDAVGRGEDEGSPQEDLGHFMTASWMPSSRPHAPTSSCHLLLFPHPSPCRLRLLSKGPTAVAAGESATWRPRPSPGRCSSSSSLVVFVADDMRVSDVQTRTSTSSAVVAASPRLSSELLPPARSRLAPRFRLAPARRGRRLAPTSATLTLADGRPRLGRGPVADVGRPRRATIKKPSHRDSRSRG